MPTFLRPTHVSTLASNALTGAIPTGIRNLVGLNYFYLSKNGLPGVILPTIGNLLQLEQVDLSINGMIPFTLGNLSFLNYFNVFWNNINGPIPRAINLQHLWRYRCIYLEMTAFVGWFSVDHVQVFQLQFTLCKCYTYKC